LVIALGAALWSGSRWEPSSVPARERAERVVGFVIPHLSWGDFRAGPLPNLRRLAFTGAVAAMSVRTASAHPDVAEGYATLGAAARVEAPSASGDAYDAGQPFENGTAAQALARRTGRGVGGRVVVVGGPETVRANEGKHLPTLPGALGDALHRAGLRPAAV